MRAAPAGALRSEVNKRLIAEDKSWPKDKSEARADFKARVLDMYKAIPAAAVRKACRNTPKRLKQVLKAKGGHIPRD